MGEGREERGATPLTCFVGWRSSGQGPPLIPWGEVHTIWNAYSLVLPTHLPNLLEGEIGFWCMYQEINAYVNPYQDQIIWVYSKKLRYILAVQAQIYTCETCVWYSPTHKCKNTYGETGKKQCWNFRTILYMGARNWVEIVLSYTGPPGYIGWRNRFLEIESWAP